MSLDHAILGFLRERPMTGYDLKTICFDERAAHYWTADQAQIYRTLDRLESRDLVSARRQRQRSRPDRKIYSITSAGVDELERWVARPQPPPPLRDPFLIQVHFASSLPDDELVALLRARRVTLQERLEALRGQAAADSAGSATSPSAPSSPTAGVRDALLARLTLDAAMADARASIDWLDDSIEILEAEAEQTRDLPPGTQRRLFASGEDERRRSR